MNYTAPIFLTGIRMFLAGIVLLVYQYFYARASIFVFNPLLAVLSDSFLWRLSQYMMRFWALESITASKSMFLFNVAPFVSSLYSYFAFNERMTKRQWMGSGLVLLAYMHLDDNNTGQKQPWASFYLCRGLSWQHYLPWRPIAITGLLCARWCAYHSYSPDDGQWRLHAERRFHGAYNSIFCGRCIPGYRRYTICRAFDIYHYYKQYYLP